MKSNFSRWVSRASAGVLLSALLAACGGGGGGGSDAPPGVIVNDAISVSLPAGTAIKEESFAGTPHTTNFDVLWSGNANAMNGRTLYVVVEMPDAALYQAQPQVVLGNGFANVTLVGDAAGWSAEGHYTGTMRVHACLDAECRTQLANSPLSVPYDILVKPRLKLSATTLALQSTYGATPPTGRVTVSSPANAADWFISGGGGVASRQGNELVVQPTAFMPAGTHTFRVTVETFVVPANGDFTLRTIMQETLTVNYTVAASNYVPYTMTPTSLSYSLRQGDPRQRAERVTLTAPDGTFELRDIREDGQPAAAVGHPSLSTWLLASDPYNFIFNACGAAIGTNCMPVGTYTATLLYRHTSSGGAITDFELPVTMNITP